MPWYTVSYVWLKYAVSALDYELQQLIGLIAQLTYYHINVIILYLENNTRPDM